MKFCTLLREYVRLLRDIMDYNDHYPYFVMYADGSGHVVDRKGNMILHFGKKETWKRDLHKIQFEINKLKEQNK